MMERVRFKAETVKVIQADVHAMLERLVGQSVSSDVLTDLMLEFGQAVWGSQCGGRQMPDLQKLAEWRRMRDQRDRWMKEFG